MSEQLAVLVAELGVKLEGVCADIAEMKGTSLEVLHTLKGEGERSGLCTRVALIEKECRGRADDRRRLRQRSDRIIAGTVLSAVGLIATLVALHVQNMWKWITEK